MQTRFHIKTCFIKASLVFFGVLLALLFVEAGFRLGGIILSAGQKIGNRRNVDAEGLYRILCLGESTTSRQWPPLLEKELNDANAGMAFKVIDAGLSGTHTGAILSRLDDHLEEFRPHMVVTMMGANDYAWIWKDSSEPEDKAGSRIALMLKETRVNKLATYIADGLKNRKRTAFSNISDGPSAAKGDAHNYVAAGNAMRDKGDLEQAERLFNAAMRADPKNPEAYRSLQALYLATRDLEKEEAVLKAGIELMDADSVQWFYAELMDFYARVGRIEEAEKIFTQAIGRFPASADFHFRMGYIHNYRFEFEKAKAAFASAIKFDPHNSHYYFCLGWLYGANGDAEKAESIFQAGLKTVPNDASLYKALADLYQDSGKFAQSEAAYLTAIKIHPERFDTHLQLGRLYYNHQKFKNAVDSFKAAIKIDPANTWTYFELEKVYRALGENNKAAEIESQGNALMGGYWAGERGQKMQAYPPMATIRNYRKVKDLVLKRNIKLVCMQYPMRPLEGLVRMLGDDNRVLYVENIDNFVHALKTRPPTDIFTDLFAGDFGHCTEFGNRLIAKNLADAILRDVFKKK